MCLSQGCVDGKFADISHSSRLMNISPGPGRSGRGEEWAREELEEEEWGGVEQEEEGAVVVTER